MHTISTAQLLLIQQVIYNSNKQSSRQIKTNNQSPQTQNNNAQQNATCQQKTNQQPAKQAQTSKAQPKNHQNHQTKTPSKQIKATTPNS